MGFLKRKQVGHKKYICLGCFQVPYETIKSDEKTVLKIGFMSIPYERYEKDETNYLKIFGVNICLDKFLYNRKQAHYLDRDKLSDDYCKKNRKNRIMQLHIDSGAEWHYSSVCLFYQRWSKKWNKCMVCTGIIYSIFINQRKNVLADAGTFYPFHDILLCIFL